MTSLEDEFQKMVQALYQSIEDRYIRGELTAAEADELQLRFQDRLGVAPPEPPEPQSRGWEQSSWCNLLGAMIELGKALPVKGITMSDTKIDLEQQFELLMRIARKNVADKVNTGELTEDEGRNLIEIIDERTQTGGWQSSSALC